MAKQRGTDDSAADFPDDSGKKNNSPGAEVGAHHLVDLAVWLKAQDVLLQMALVTQGLELSASSDAPDDEGQLAIDVSAGQLVLEAPVADLERLLLRALQEQAAQKGATVKKLSLRLESVRTRELALLATVQAGQGFLSATVELRGRVVITDTFHVRIADADVRGQGMLGGMAAMWLRPHVEKVQDNEYHISSVLPGNLDIQDVRLEVDEHLRMIVALAGSSVRMERPSAEAAPRGKKSGRGARGPSGKFDIFIVDTGTNERAKAALDRHLSLFQSFLAQQNVFTLTTTQSHELLRRHPSMRGADPILLVVDRERPRDGAENSWALRFRLGALGDDPRVEAALDRLLGLLDEAEAGEAGPLHMFVELVEFEG